MPEPDPALPIPPPPDNRNTRAVTLAEAQRQLTARFRAAGLDTPALDARLLVTAALGLDAAAGISRPELTVTAEAAVRIEAFACRRLAREPVSRILGVRQFYGLDLEIGPATLDPRPETETLVDAALDMVRAGEVPSSGAPSSGTPYILDLGTGSGAIIIALLTALTASRGVATDIDPATLAIARRNAERHGVGDRLQFATAQWFDGLAGQVSRTFDLIVSNPPYIPADRIAGLDPEVAIYDPRGALDGGPDGLDAYRRIMASAAVALSPGGWLLLEIGCDQKDDISKIAKVYGILSQNSAFRAWNDLAGAPRCVAFQARAGAPRKKELGIRTQSR